MKYKIEGKLTGFRIPRLFIWYFIILKDGRIFGNVNLVMTIW